MNARAFLLPFAIASAVGALLFAGLTAFAEVR
jgi:hypothetical protein